MLTAAILKHHANSDEIRQAETMFRKIFDGEMVIRPFLTINAHSGQKQPDSPDEILQAETIFIKIFDGEILLRPF